jgi:predicted nucleic acid-binding Zn ribbon protein
VQGSVLGPILFLIFINDITSASNDKVSIKLFADDVKLYSIIDIGSSTASLQQSIDYLVSWASNWQLNINISKCNVLSLRNRSHSSVSVPYYVNQVCLNNSNLVSDLGILVDTELTYNQHISSVIAKATQRAGVFFRGFTSRNLSLIRKTFVTYIRPILEYNSSVWNPTKKYLIDQLEKVQRRYTKRVPSLSHLSYLERLSILNLEPLELRRLKLDLILYYKIIHNLTSISPSQYFQLQQPTRCLRTPLIGHVLKKPNTFNRRLLSSFFNRCIDCWNNLPETTKEATSVFQFKKSLSEIDFAIYLKGSAFNNVR